MSNGDTAPRDRKQHARTGLLTSFMMIAGSGYFEMLTGLVRSIFQMRLLGPTGQGLVNIVQLIERYLSNSHLGALHGISKRLPAAIGAGEEEEAQRIEDAGVTWNLLTASVSALGIIVAAIVVPTFEPLTRLVLLIGAFVYLCDQLYNLYRTVARAWQVYRPLVVSSVVMSLSLTTFILLGAWRAKALGAMLGWLLAATLAMLAQYFGVRVMIRLRLEFGLVWKLILAGLPLAAMATGDTFLTSVDSLVLAKHGGIYYLGLYMGIAGQTRRYIFNLVRNLSFVLLPHLLEEFSRFHAVDRLRRMTLEPTVALAVGVPFLAAFTAVFLPPAARTFVPKFLAAVPAGQIVAFGTCIMTLPIALSNSLIALDREWEAVAGQAAGTLAIVLFAWGPAGRGDLTGLAYAACFGAWCTMATLGLVAMGRLGLSLSRSLLYLFALQIPLAWSVGAWMGANYLAGPLHLPGETAWLGAIERFGIMFVLLLPLTVYTVSRFDVLARVRDAIAQRKLARRGDDTGQQSE